MNAIDAAGEIAVRPLRFGDPVLIEAIEILDSIAELEKLTGNSRRCRWCCGHNWDRMDIGELRRHVRNERAAAARKEAIS
jgi:hypothetical protein